MIQNIDYIYVPKADINEGLATGVITRAALYFTKEYLFVVPFGSLEVLYAGMDTKFNNMENYVGDLNKQLSDLDTKAFNSLLLNLLKEERIYRISELEMFSIQTGFWIFGGMRLRKKGGQLQAFNIQPSALRGEIKAFYGI